MYPLKASGVHFVRPGGKAYVCTRIESAAFTLGNTHYPPGSWLVMGPEDTYARAMTDAEFTAWIDTMPVIATAGR